LKKKKNTYHDDDENDESKSNTPSEITAHLYLNLHGNHFSYIKDLKSYNKSYCCARCGKFWKHVGKLHRHELTCEGKVKHAFPGKTYKTSKTVFDELEDIGVTVPDNLRYLPYREAFDLECYFQDNNDLWYCVTSCHTFTWGLLFHVT